MARTKSSVGAKVSAVKSSKARSIGAAATRIKKAGSSRSSSKGYRTRHSRGNPVCPRKTPEWQKPITHFFHALDNSTESDSETEVEYRLAAVFALKKTLAKRLDILLQPLGGELRALINVKVAELDESKTSQESFNKEMETLEIGELNNNNQIGGEQSAKVVVKGKGKGKGKKSKLPSKHGSTHVVNKSEVVNKETESMSD